MLDFMDRPGWWKDNQRAMVSEARARRRLALLGVVAAAAIGVAPATAATVDPGRIGGEYGVVHATPGGIGHYAAPRGGSVLRD